MTDLNEGGRLPFSELPAWEEVARSFRTGAVPQCWAIRAPSDWHVPLLEVLSRLYLCDNGDGDDGCGGCRGWSQGGHPDRIVIGDFGAPPNIDACRTLIRELPLMPLAARQRLGVVLAAEKMLIHAANSLLKIAEEPPSHSRLLFLMEGDDFLPTLRSRSRFTVLAAPSRLTARPMPEKDGEWLSLIELLRAKSDDTDVVELLSSWVSHAMLAGDVGRAAEIERLRLFVAQAAPQKKLSQNMIGDALMLILKEELPFEHIFGDIW